MTGVGFGLLSAIIGLVIFGSAMALGFQASTNIVPFGGPAESPADSMRETSVAYRTAEDSSETSGMAVPTALKGSISAPPLARTSGDEAVSDGRLAYGGVVTGAERATAKDTQRLKPFSAPANRASGTASAAAKGPKAAPPAAGDTDLAAPLSGVIAIGATAPQKNRSAFESSTPMQLGAAGDGADEDIVIFEYPIPQVATKSQLQLGEDPLTSAALEVPQGARRPLDSSFAFLAPAGPVTVAPKASTQPTDAGLLSGDFVLTFNLTDDQLMLVFMVTGLLTVAIFLWLASSWLGDRSALKRQREWDRQQEAAQVAAEDADTGANGTQNQAAA